MPSQPRPVAKETGQAASLAEQALRRQPGSQPRVAVTAVDRHTSGTLWSANRVRRRAAASSAGQHFSARSQGFKPSSPSAPETLRGRNNAYHGSAPPNALRRRVQRRVSPRRNRRPARGRGALVGREAIRRAKARTGVSELGLMAIRVATAMRFPTTTASGASLVTTTWRDQPPRTERPGEVPSYLLDGSKSRKKRPRAGHESAVPASPRRASREQFLRMRP